MSFNQKQRVLICGLDHDTSDQSIQEYFSRFGTISHCSIKRDHDGKSRGFDYVTFKELSSTKDCIRSDTHTIDGKKLHLNIVRMKGKKQELASSTDNPPHSPVSCEQPTIVRASPSISHAESFIPRPESSIPNEPLSISRTQTSIPNEQPSERKIFIGGLRAGIDENNVREHFSQFGKIHEIIIMKHKDGKPRGFSFVTFEDHCAVKAILEKQHIIQDRTLSVRIALPKETMNNQQKEIKNNSNFSRSHIGPIRSNKHCHNAPIRRNDLRFRPYQQRIQINSGTSSTQINIFLN